VDIDPGSIMREEKQYRDLPKYYDFGSTEEKEKLLRKNMILIRQEVEEIIVLYI
jgi:DNA-directed RNA polymerase specialized sigma subunit